MTTHQGEFMMDDVVNVGEDLVNAGEYQVQIVWVSLGDDKPTSDQVSVIDANAPKVHRYEAKRMVLNSATK